MTKTTDSGDEWSDEDSMPQDIHWTTRAEPRVRLPAAACRGVRDCDDGVDLWFMPMGLDPRLVLPWRYTPHQYHLPKCEFRAVHVHDARAENGVCYSGEAFEAALRAVNALAAEKDGPLQYHLLINPDGLPDDPARLGVDHAIDDPQSGTRFVFSVRRIPAHGGHHRILVASRHARDAGE
jgi:hypothetical protein